MMIGINVVGKIGATMMMVGAVQAIGMGMLKLVVGFPILALQTLAILALLALVHLALVTPPLLSLANLVVPATLAMLALLVLAILALVLLDSILICLALLMWTWVGLKWLPMLLGGMRRHKRPCRNRPGWFAMPWRWKSSQPT